MWEIEKKRDDTSVGCLVFIGVLVAIGAGVAFVAFENPFVAGLCLALGGGVAGWLHGKNNRLYLQRGLKAGALTGFVVVAFVVIASTPFVWTHHPSLYELLRFAGWTLWMGFGLIVAGGIGGLAGSALWHAFFQTPFGQADDASEDSGAGRSSSRIYRPTIAVVITISCVYWVYILLSVLR
jgi:hypothetical protein